MGEFARGDRVLFRSMSPGLRRTYQEAWGDITPNVLKNIPRNIINIYDDHYAGSILQIDPSLGFPFYHVQLDRMVFYGSYLSDGTPFVEGLKVVRESVGNLIKIPNQNDDLALQKPDFFSVRKMLNFLK